MVRTRVLEKTPIKKHFEEEGQVTLKNVVDSEEKMDLL